MIVNKTPASPTPVSVDEDDDLDDLLSVDLSALSDELKKIPDEEFLEILAGKHRFQDKGKVFHLSIIDYLQGYTNIKKAERFFVPLVKGCDGETVSVQEPRFYGDRFQEFMNERVFTK